LLSIQGIPGRKLRPGCFFAVFRGDAV